MYNTRGKKYNNNTKKPTTGKTPYTGRLASVINEEIQAIKDAIAASEQSNIEYRLKYSSTEDSQHHLLFVKKKRNELTRLYAERETAQAEEAKFVPCDRCKTGQTSTKYRYCKACYDEVKAGQTAVAVAVVEKCKKCGVADGPGWCKECRAQFAKLSPDVNVLCVTCGEPTKKGQPWCSTCHDEFVKLDPSKKKELNSQSRPCATCGEATRFGSWCDTCYAKHKADMKCKNCGEHSDTGKSYCSACYFDHHARPCVDCGTKTMDGKWCRECYLQYKQQPSSEPREEAEAEETQDEEVQQYTSDDRGMHDCKGHNCKAKTYYTFCKECKEAHDRYELRPNKQFN